MQTSPQPRNVAATPEDSWSRCMRHLVLRAPCLLPFISVAGAAWGGQGWALPVAAVSCAYLLGMCRVLLMCLVCSLLVLVRTSQHEDAAADLLRSARRDGYAMVEGTVVRELSRGCVVATGWNKPAVLLRGEVPFRCGDSVQVVGSFRESPEPLYPGMFDVPLWLHGQGIGLELDYIRGDRTGRPLSLASLRGFASVCRESCERVLMPPGTETDPRRQLLCALVLGDKEHADADVMQDFQRGGCLHVFAVSGLHVGLVAGLIWLAARVLRLKPAWTRLLVLLLPGLYVMLTGLALPALRAYLMLSLVLGGVILRRQVSLLNIWCFAGAAILLVSPWQVGQSSFLLSFVVYGAICLGLRCCMRESPWFGPDAYLPFRAISRGEMVLKRLDMWLRGVVMVAIIAWIASLPLSLAFFHAFNVYGILANIAIAPVLPLVMGAGLLHLCLGWVPWLGSVLGWVSLKSAGGLLSLVAFFANLPCAYIPAQSPRSTQEAVVVSLGYGNSACLLGNNGLLIDCGSEKSARFTLQPLLFHMGFSPSALLKTRGTASRSGGEAVLRAWLPKLQCLPCGESASEASLLTNAGTFRIHYPPADLPSSPSANMAPVVTWRSGRHLLVYVGDASLSTLEHVQEDLSSASILVLGHNPDQMVDAETLRLLMPGACVILLPSAVAAGVSEGDFFPVDVSTTRKENSYFLFNLDD